MASSGYYPMSGQDQATGDSVETVASPKLFGSSHSVTVSFMVYFNHE